MISHNEWSMFIMVSLHPIHVVACRLFFLSYQLTSVQHWIIQCGMFLPLFKSLFILCLSLCFVVFFVYIIHIYYIFLDFIHAYIFNCFYCCCFSYAFSWISFYQDLEIYSFLCLSPYLMNDYHMLELYPLYFLLPQETLVIANSFEHLPYQF